MKDLLKKLLGIAKTFWGVIFSLCVVASIYGAFTDDVNSPILWILMGIVFCVLIYFCFRKPKKPEPVIKNVYANKEDFSKGVPLESEKTTNQEVTLPAQQKKPLSCGKPLIIFVVIFVVLAVIVGTSTGSTPSVNNNVKMLMTESGLSQEVCEQVYAQLQECGIETITDIKTIVESDGTWYSCRIKSDKYYGSGVVNIVPKKGLESLNWGGATIYNSETLKNPKHLDDYALPYGADASYMLQVENTIKNYLKSPSTAEFPSRFFSDEWSFEYSYKDGIATVSSYVDAQNSFGAMIRSPFVVKIDVKKNAVIYVNLDGQIYQ